MPFAEINGAGHHWIDQGAGEVVLLLHGAAQTNASLALHIAGLSETHRVIAPDLRSMGKSEHVASMSPSAWIDDAVALLEHLGVEQAHIYGVSLGARIGLRLAIDYPQKVKSLILERPIIAMRADTNAQLNTNINSGAKLTPQEEAAREAQHGADWRTVLANYSAIRNQPELQAHLDLRELSKSVTIPTLILRGDEREVVHPIEHCLELYQNIPGSWLWIRANTKGALAAAAPEEFFPTLRAHMARAA
ncbi:alpha/beta fold hydrolase [Phenylobacterium immobile]|uniref:alpha/beta fold hydrolase n=1 Tax=Phenylobacterium immobile TaxID=21 RepID=UPI000AE1A637|nr:alpha/beta hydrolase [Phenylobacterium immobile]